ncbi:MAG: CHAT domain-containing protein [Planctomycetota bacterium]
MLEIESGVGITGLTVPATGRLSIWVEWVGHDTRINVDPGSGGSMSDDDSGGGSTPWVELEVDEGDCLQVRVEAEVGATGVASLRSVVSPVTAPLDHAVERLRDDLREIRRHRSKDELEIATALLADAFARALEVEGAGRSTDIADALARLAVEAGRLGTREFELELRRHVYEQRVAWLPAGHPERTRALDALVDALIACECEEESFRFRKANVESLATCHGESSDVALRARSSLAIALARAGRLGEGLPELERAHARWAERLDPADPALLVARRNLAMMRWNSGDFEGTLEMEGLVIDALSKVRPPDDRELLSLGVDRCTSLRKLGRIDEARRSADEILALYEASYDRDDPDVREARSELVLTLSRLGDYARAAEESELLVASCRRALAADDVEMIRALSNLALMRGYIGDRQGAVDLLREAVQSVLGMVEPSHPFALDLQSNLAVAEYECGNTAEALELQERLLEIREHLAPPDDPAVVAARENLALTRCSAGDFDAALDMQRLVVEERAKALPPGHPERVQALQNLALIHSRSGNSLEALALDREVFEAYSSRLPAQHPNLIASRESLATSLVDCGHYAEALEHLEHVLEARLEELPAWHPNVLATRVNIAVALRGTGEFERAYRILREVVDERSTALPFSDAEVVEVQLKLGELAYLCSDWERLHSIQHDLLSELREQKDRLTVEPRVARRIALSGLRHIEWCRFWSHELAAHEQPSLELELVEAIESLRAASLQGGAAGALVTDGEFRDLSRAVALAREELARMAGNIPTDVQELEQWRRAAVEAAARRDRSLRALARRRTELLGGAAPPSLKSFVDSLPPGSFLVTYSRYDRLFESTGTTRRFGHEDVFSAYVIGHDGSTRLVPIGLSSEVVAAVEHWRSTIGRPYAPRGLGLEVESGESALDSAAQAGRALRELILDPVLASVPEVEQLVVVPDDVLHLVPFDALPAPSGEPIGSELRIQTRTIALSSFGSELVAPREGVVVVVGGADYGKPDGQSPRASLESLPGAQIEARAVADLCEQHLGGAATLLVSEHATKEAVAERAASARYLHLATHGWFADASRVLATMDGASPLDQSTRVSIDRARDTIVGYLPETLCGLALAGANGGAEGILTAEELGSLDLTHCELAVLSACETNVGIRRAGQGIQSLQTALHAAGARTAICSLWKVDDAATRRLFEVFYTKLWKEHLGKADALWAAKMALRDEGHPVRDWAGWVLTGAAE